MLRRGPFRAVRRQAAAPAQVACCRPHALRLGPARRPARHARVERGVAWPQAVGAFPPEHAPRGARCTRCVARQYCAQHRLQIFAFVTLGESSRDSARMGSDVRLLLHMPRQDARVQVVLPKEPGLERESVSWFARMWPRTQAPRLADAPPAERSAAPWRRHLCSGRCVTTPRASARCSLATLAYTQQRCHRTSSSPVAPF